MRETCHSTLTSETQHMKSLASNWVFRVSGWIGISPYDHQGRQTKSRQIYFTTTFLALTAITLTVRSAHLRETYSSGNPALKTMTFSAIFLHSVILCALGAHNIQNARNKREFERVFRLVRIPETFLSDRILLIFALAGHAVCFATSLSQYLTSTGNSLLSENILSLSLMVLQWGNCLSFLIVLQFSSLIRTIRLEIENMTRNCQFTVNGCSELLRVAERWNGLYGWQIAFTMVQSSGYLVVYAYANIAYFLIYGEINWRYASVNGLLNLIRTVQLWTTVDQPYRFNRSAEAFNNELFKLMRSNKELCRDSRLFLYVTMRQTVRFTACGFFDLGYPLVTSIIAAATTYLVILLQFSMPTKQ